MPARDELRRDLRQVRRRGFHQQYINHDGDHQAAHDHKPTAVRWLHRQVVDRGVLLRLTMTGPNTVEGLAIHRFLFDDGPSHGEAAISSGTVSNNELVLRLRPGRQGPARVVPRNALERPP